MFCVKERKVLKKKENAISILFLKVFFSALKLSVYVKESLFTFDKFVYPC